jgi:hypothetical protein
LNYDPIYKSTPQTEIMTKTYQWTKGEKQGSVVKSSGETFFEENIEYMVFLDGGMINTALINEYLIEIPNETEGILMNDLAPTPLRRVEKKKESSMQEIAASSSAQKQKVELSPIERLLLDCKKAPMSFSFTIKVDMPSLDLVKILADSYEDGEEQILKFLSSSINLEEVKEKLSAEMKKKLFEKVEKSKSDQ